VAHNDLGVSLARKGQMDEAIACYKKAIKLEPKNANTYFYLGIVLKAKSQLDEAIACYKKAIEIDPNLAVAHGALGEVLLHLGSYAEAKEALTRALELIPEKHPMRAIGSKQLQDCEGLLKLEVRLPRLLQGEDKSGSARESLDLARMCQLKRLYAATARFFTDAFTADPKLADSFPAQHRYNASCSAALAAAGQGEDAAKLDDAAKSKLRSQALDWLKADLTVVGKLLDSGPAQARPFIVQTLTHWQNDTDLVGIRDKTSLAKLPADEQKAFAQLWSDVAALLMKAEEKSKYQNEQSKYPPVAPMPRVKW
jgi:tetratricopeptide (TPR) repeat protein